MADIKKNGLNSNGLDKIFKNVESKKKLCKEQGTFTCKEVVA